MGSCYCHAKSYLKYFAGEASALGLQPQEVMNPKQFPLIGALHGIKVPPCALHADNRALQLLIANKNNRVIYHFKMHMLYFQCEIYMEYLIGSVIPTFLCIL